MSCGGSDSVAINSQARRLKDGIIMRYKGGFFGGKWKQCYAVLYEDSAFAWYDEQGDSKPLGAIILKNHIPFFAVGQMTDRIPATRPTLPSGASVHHVIAIGTGNKGEKINWFLFRSDSELTSWMTEVMKTFPPPPQPPSGQPPMQQPPPQVGYPAAGPPPYYSSQTLPTYPPPPGNNNRIIPQGVPPNNTTVVVQQTPGYAGGYGYGGGGGMGFGEGMLLGGLMGYGLGSHWGLGYGGYGGYGFGGGWGGYGYGGGIQDNDTTIINNYYDNNGDGGYDQSQGMNGDAGGNDGGYADAGGYDATGGYDDGGGYDYGGGDFGGGDFGGGDFGGGDFGGGGDF